MRLTAYHDSKGNIIGMSLTPGKDAVSAQVMLDKHPGLYMAQVDVPAGVTFDLKNPAQINGALAGLAKTFKVDKGSLARRA